MAVYDLEFIGQWFSKDQIMERKLQAEEVLFRQNEPANSFFFVVSGEIRTENYLENGQSVVFFRARMGAVLAEENLHFSQYLYSGVATMPTVVRHVSKVSFLDKLHNERGFSQAISSCLAQRYSEAMMLRELLSVKSAKDRLMMWLQWQDCHGTKEVDLDRRMGSIAPDLGLTQESVYRAFKRLEQSGKIRRHSGRIELLNIN